MSDSMHRLSKKFIDETKIMASMTALDIEGLKKRYKNGVEALKGIDLEVKEGDFFGLLGPNGAGKSTVIGILTSIVNKTSGKAKIFGVDIDKDFNKAKTLIGVVPQEMNFNIFEKVEDILINQAGYYGIPRLVAKKRAEKYMKLMELWEKRHQKSMTLSGGMKRRLMIARALIHEPKLLILDEPTAGVDVELRRGMWAFLKKINEQGTTIVLTTHYLEEAEALCNTIAIIDKGIVIEIGQKKQLISKLDKETFIFDLKKPYNRTKKPPCCEMKVIDDTTLEIEVMKGQDLNAIFRHFDRYGVGIASMRNKTNRLEELFVELTKGDRK